MGPDDIPWRDCLHGTEGDLLLFALDRVHRQLAWKTSGLTTSQLAQTHPPSRSTLAGTLMHLSKVEERWTASAAGRPPGFPVTGSDPITRGDAEWDLAPGRPAAELEQIWLQTVTRCRAEWTDLVADGGLDETAFDPDPAYQVNRRRRLVDILEENLLHTGQASVLRESIDGLVGNDPP